MKREYAETVVIGAVYSKDFLVAGFGLAHNLIPCPIGTFAILTLLLLFIRKVKRANSKNLINLIYGYCLALFLGAACLSRVSLVVP